MRALNTVDDATPQPVSQFLFSHQHFPSNALGALMLEIMTTGLTGSLTINFHAGSPSGTMEWKQKHAVPAKD